MGRRPLSNKRSTGHRAQRDTANRENAELKKEVDGLKRQVSRLKREIERLNDPEDDKTVPVEAEPETEQKKCPSCKSARLSCITTPAGITRYACKACKDWRGVL